MKKWRTLIVDDNPGFLKAMQTVLARMPGVEVVGAALSGAQALEQVEQLAPDLVLMDVRMPGMNGFDATRCIRALHPATQVAIVTGFEEPYYYMAAQRSGAIALISKFDIFKSWPTLITRLALAAARTHPREGRTLAAARIAFVRSDLKRRIG